MASDLPTLAREIAQQYGLDPSFFVAQIQQESGFDANAVSSKGCAGIAQICDSVNFDPRDPIASLHYMAQRMSDALKRYNGNAQAALASYNCGIGCADAWVAGKSDLPSETRSYIGAIQQRLSGFPDWFNSLAIGGFGNNGSNAENPSAFTPQPTVTFSPAPLPKSVSTVIIVVVAIPLLLMAFARSSASRGE